MKHIIYTTEADLAEYFKDYEEANECTLTEEQKDDLAYNWAVDNFDAEKKNLEYVKLKYDTPLIAIANLGRWNGRCVGYKEIDEISDFIDWNGRYDFVEVYADRYNVNAILSDHDGTTYATLRQMKPNRSYDNFVDKLLNCRNEAEAKKLITSYTVSVVKAVNELYGW